MLEKILHKLLKQGEDGHHSNNQQDTYHKALTSEVVQSNHINCYEGYTLISPFKDDPYDSSIFQTIVNNNKHQGSAKCMKIMGLVTYAAHTWRDKVYLRLNKNCNHTYQCPCKDRLLKKRTLDRPFIS